MGFKMDYEQDNIAHFLGEFIVGVGYVVKGCRVHVHIENAVENSRVVAVIVTVEGGKDSARVLLVRAVDHVEDGVAVLDAVGVALNALMAENKGGIGRGVESLLKPPQLLGGYVIAYFVLVEVIAKREVNILAVNIHIVRVEDYHTVAAAVEEVIIVRHTVELENILVERLVGLVIAEAVIGRNVKIVVGLGKGTDVLRLGGTMAEIARMNHHFAAGFHSAALQQGKILPGAAHVLDGIVMQIRKKQKFCFSQNKFKKLKKF